MKASYFEDMYAADGDPWGFRTRWYEQRKYAVTLASLSRPRYRSVFEPGCSIGVLSAQLAERADRLLSVDLVPAAARQARERLAGHGHTEVRQWDAHDPWPDERFDLVVVSEMLYYLDAPDARVFMDEAAAHLQPDGEVVVVHWRPTVPEYPLTGDQANEIACATTGLTKRAHYEDADFVLDLLVPGAAGEAGSVAALDGLRDDLG